MIANRLDLEKLWARVKDLKNHHGGWNPKVPWEKYSDRALEISHQNTSWNSRQHQMSPLSYYLSNSCTLAWNGLSNISSCLIAKCNILPFSSIFIFKILEVFYTTTLYFLLKRLSLDFVTLLGHPPLRSIFSYFFGLFFLLLLIPTCWYFSRSYP